MDNYNAILETIPVTGTGPTVGIKANIAVKDHICHGGIKAYDQVPEGADAMVVKRLRDAGYEPAATVNMEEGALGAQTDNPWFGKTFNPLKDGYTAGGSSGGSAASVAGDLVDVALGTDTMGSVRIPSAYCGLWGFKPSHDVRMLEGVMPLASTLDTVGAHGKSLDDVVALTEAICGRTFQDGKAGEITRLDWGESVVCTSDVQVLFDDFVSKCGYLPPIRLDGYEYGTSRRAGLIISEVEGYQFHQEKLEKNPEGFSDFFRGMLEYGAGLPKDKVQAAYDHMTRLREADFADFILMPTAPQTAFKFGDPVPANQADFTAFSNLADRPAIAFPIGVTVEGLPVSAQLVGPRGREADLVATVRTLPIL